MNLNTFYRTCIYLCIGLLVFTLVLNYVQSTGAFPMVGTGGQDISGTEEVLGEVTDLEEPNMDYLWGIVIGGIAAGLVVGAITHSIVPAGLFIFGSVFWASYIKTHVILSYGGYIPEGFLMIFSIVTVFIFIAACAGVLTGSG